MNNFKKIAADAAEKYSQIDEVNFADVVARQKEKYGGKLPDKYPAAKKTASNLDVGTSKAAKVYSGKPQHKDIFGHDTKSQASGATGPRASIMQHAANKIKKVFSKEEVEQMDEADIEEMSDSQMKTREHNVKSMKKNFGDFRKRYGDKAKSVMYATATKQAMKEDEDQDTEDMHYCAKHVYSDLFGEGFVLEGQHAEPNDEGEIDWYMVEFDDGIRKIPTHKLEIMVAEYHMNHKKKKKMMEEEEELEEMSSKMKMKLGLYGKKKKMMEEEELEEGLQDRKDQGTHQIIKTHHFPDKSMAMTVKDKETGDENVHVGNPSHLTKMLKTRYGLHHTLMWDKSRVKTYANEANDGNLANNAPPYDKVTHGDVITGRLGKDHQGGKSKHARERSKYQAKGVPMGPAEMLSKLKGMK